MPASIALRRATRAAALLLVVALAACGDSSTAPATEDGNGGNSGGNPLPVVVARIDVAPLEQGAVLVGSQRQFRATLRAADGSVISGRSVTWSISHAERGQIDAVGTVTARQPGLVVVTATSEGKSGTAQLEIAARTVARLDVSVQALDLQIGDQRPVQALALDALGQLIADAPIAWSSADPNVATVDNSGLVTAMHGGETILTVSSGSATATVAVRIPRTLRMVLKGVDGGALPALIDQETSLSDEPSLTHRIRWVAKSGTLDLSMTGDMKWRQELRVTVYEDLISSVGGNTIVTTTEMDTFTLLDEGTQGADASGLYFQSGTAGRARYATRMGMHGGLWITQRPLGYGAERVLYFAQP